MSEAPKSKTKKSNARPDPKRQNVVVNGAGPVLAVLRQGGQPSKYKHEFSDEARAMVRLGATDSELADYFDVSIATIGYWRAQFPKFHEALKSGKDVFDERVERSLAIRALGYSYDAVKIFREERVTIEDGVTTVDKVTVEVPYREHVPPDVTACIFWLKNRQSERWRDVQHHKHGGTVHVTVSPGETKW